MKDKYTSIRQIPLVLDAAEVANVLGISKTGAYELMHSKGFPTIRLGKRRMVVERDKLLRWMDTRSGMTRWEEEEEL